MQVVCHGCGAQYELGPEYAGKRVRCRTCQAVITVPALGPAADPGAWDSQAGSPGDPDPYRSPTAAGGAQPPYYSFDRAASMESHRKLIGIFGIIVAVFSFLWAAFAAFVVVAAVAMSQELPARHRAEEMWLPVAIYGAMFVLSTITGILQLTAAVKVLRGSRGARNWGVVSGVISCASLWGFCVYPFSLAAGIYMLVILLAPDARSLLETRRAGAWPPGQSAPLR